MLSTETTDTQIEIQKEFQELEEKRKFIESELSENPSSTTEEEQNPILDKPVRVLVNEFGNNWNQIFVELLETERYNNLNRGNYVHDFFKELYYILKDIFWKPDRLFHVGIGFVILSFFMYFIFVTDSEI